MSVPQSQLPVPNPGYVITVKDVYDKLSTVADKLGELSGHLIAIDSRNQNADKVHADFEARLRKVEAWRYALPITSITAIASVVVAVLAFMHGGAH